jgi:hypothetical protein
MRLNLTGPSAHRYGLSQIIRSFPDALRLIVRVVRPLSPYRKVCPV